MVKPPLGIPERAWWEQEIDFTRMVLDIAKTKRETKQEPQSVDPRPPSPEKR